MERFLFRPITLADIAATLGKNSPGLTLTSSEEGVVTIHTPNLTVAQRAALRSLYTTSGYVEDPTMEF